MYQFKDITYKVGSEQYLYSTNFTLEEGSFNILLGPTNAGKTTLLRLIAGLDKVSSGKIYLNNEEITHYDAKKRNISFVYQLFINYPNFTVSQNIASPMVAEGKSKDLIKQETEKIAELLKLTPFLNRRPSELSGGQQQRVAIGRALAKDSKIILLDEPFVNLDYKLREELREELPKFFKGRERTIIYTTTDPNEALLLQGTLFTMDLGKITGYGPTMSVFRKPINLEMAKVFSYPPINTSEATFSGGMLKSSNNLGISIDTDLPLEEGKSYTIAIRPFCLTSKKSERKDEDFVELESKVIFSELAGSESYTHLKVNGVNWVMHEHNLVNYGVGDHLKIYVKKSEIMIFDQTGYYVSTTAGDIG